MGSRRRCRNGEDKDLVGGLTRGHRHEGSSPDIDLHVSNSGSGNHSHSISLSDTFQSSASRDKSQRVKTPGSPAGKHTQPFSSLLRHTESKQDGILTSLPSSLLQGNGNPGDKSSHCKVFVSLPEISRSLMNMYGSGMLCPLSVNTLLSGQTKQPAKEGQFIFMLSNSFHT